MVSLSADVVICGAGLAGVSAAYFLSVRNGIRDVVLIDERPPLTLTSDHSTECYRNWWPGPDGAMVALMNRSIDLLEELARSSNNVFHMNRRGYLYCTGDENRLDRFKIEAEKVAQLGAGELRVHEGPSSEKGYIPASAEGFSNQPDGADLLLDSGLIKTHFPYISNSVKAALHVRRAGWLSAQQLGMYFLEQARSCGVQLLEGKVTGLDASSGRVRGVHLQDGSLIRTPCFVNAAGPFLGEIGRMLGIDLPVYNELHLKLAIQDAQGILDRSAPLVIWSDPQRLNWNAEEIAALDENEKTQILLGQLPSGVHTRPEGGPGSRMILVLWEYQTRYQQPIYPIDEDPFYPEVVLRGLVRLIPAAQAYVERMPRPRLDGGYYTRTHENRPLVGNLPLEGAFVIGALSGFGLMAACAAGELLANHITGSLLPDYAGAFMLSRYENPSYLEKFEEWGSAGQL
jgi:glycine/D-amino acid oxidase-like deaminating enzyme